MTKGTDKHQALLQRLTALAPQQRQLLLQKLRAKGVDVAALEAELALAEVPLSTADHWPLTPAQSQIWLAEQRPEKSAAYHIAMSWKFESPDQGSTDATLAGPSQARSFQTAAMVLALQQLVRRHEALQLSFDLVAAKPCQRLSPTATISVQQASLPTEQLSVAIQTLVQEPFNLSRAPLVRAGLFTIVETESQSELGQCQSHQYLLVLVWHHLIADGWSRGLILADLAQLYQQQIQAGAPEASITSGLPTPEPSTPGQYSSYVGAYQQWLLSSDCDRQKAYWRNQLATAQASRIPAPIGSVALSGAQGEDGAADFSSDTLSLQLPASITTQLQARARDNQATPFVLLLTFFNVLIHRYTQSKDILIGIPTPGRTLNNSEFNDVVGFFVNTLLLRSQPSQPEQFSSWLAATKSALSEAFDHQQLPLATIADELGRADLFRLMFQYQNQSYSTQNAQRLDDAFGGLKVSQDWIALNQTKFDMTWHGIERESGLLLVVEYRKRLYPRSYVQQLLDDFAHLLQSWLEDGKDPLSSQPQPSGLTSKTQLGTDTPNLIQGFESWVRQTPDAIAVANYLQAGEPAALTYAQLDQRAQELGVVLLRQGVKPDSRVALLLPRTPALLVAILAIHKAGAAYLPLEPTLPGQRLDFMLADAEISLVVSCDQLAGSIQLSSSLNWVLLDAHARPNAAALPTTQVVSESERAQLRERTANIGPQQLAYCIYTSGSTGQPKGTLLTQHGLSLYLQWCVEQYPLAKTLVHTSIGFDATITGLLAPLMVGGQVNLVNQDNPIQPLLQALEQGFSLIKLTPAHMAAMQPLLEIKRLAGQLPEPTTLPQALVIGGEALTRAHTEFWRRYLPSIRLINEYGPTETVVGCANYVVGDQEPAAIPIGKPIDGACLYVLDPWLRPVPTGVTGELYIGGDAVARGYLKQPALTASRFLPDPFASTSLPGAVMYRSGDLAQWRTDGELLFVGRSDQQLSIRGYRIEPGEVASKLCQQEAVAEAVVATRNQQLTAYVCFNQPPTKLSLWFNDVRQQLAVLLPEYMVPSLLVPVAAMPLTVNGKVDIEALAQLPELTSSSSSAPCSEPQNYQSAAEVLLAQAWSRVLQRDNISPQANFIELGGDSVKAMQVVAQVHKAGYQLTPAIMFQHQTIASQAEHLVPLRQTQWELPTASFQLTPIQHDFFRRVTLGQMVDPHHFNQSLVLDVDSAINPDWLYLGLQHLLLQHSSLRLGFFQQAAGDWVARYGEPGAVIELHDWSIEGWSQAELRKQLDRLQQSFDLAQAPLLTGALLKGAEGYQQLLLVAHHLIVDAVSWRLLITDLVENYQALQQSKPLPTPVASMPLSSWSQYLKQQVDYFANHKDYWLAQSIPLPAVAADVMVELTEGKMQTLEQSFSGEQIASLPSVEAALLTALSQTLCRWFELSALGVLLESHGRQAIKPDTPDCSTSLGWFTAEFPCLIRHFPGSPGQAYQGIQQQLAQVPDSGMGYGILLQANKLTPTEPLAMVNYLGQAPTFAAGFVTGLTRNELNNEKAQGSQPKAPIQLIAWQEKSQFKVLWRYPETLLSGSDMMALTQQFNNTLRSIAMDTTKPSTQDSPLVSAQEEHQSVQSAAATLASERAKSLLAKLKKPT